MNSSGNPAFGPNSTADTGRIDDDEEAHLPMGSSTTPFGHDHSPTRGVQIYDMIVQQAPRCQTTCYVGNLHSCTTRNDLVPLFQNFGVVVEVTCKCISARGFAFIKMDTHENAAMAICQLSGYCLNGRPLRCSWARGY